jgi:hypothetical protein
VAVDAGHHQVVPDQMDETSRGDHNTDDATATGVPSG